MPGAWCARRRMCDGRKQKAHALVRSHRKHPAFPAQWFTAYFVLSPVIGLFCHRRSASNPAKLDASVEASGPHDFAVRLSAIRQRRIRVHRIPPHVRDDRETPLQRGGTGESISMLLPGRQVNFGKSEIGVMLSPPHRSVGWAKAHLRRAHHDASGASRDGGHASLCPPYGRWDVGQPPYLPTS
jgi:hypothetical protein